MREDWNRATPPLNLDAAELTALIQPAFPGERVVAGELTQGGLANTNIRVRLSVADQTLLLRLFVRSPGDARKELALHRLVAPNVPVPRFLHFADDNPITGHPYALREWVEGTRLEVAAPALRPEQIGQVGRSVGAVLAAIHAITFPQTGFFDDDLNIAQPISVGGDGLRAYLHQCLIEGRGQDRLGPELTQALLAFAGREAGLLDAWSGPPCLAHADFGGSNILVRETARGWAVAAVLDWEFAFSGSPFFDFGNLLRPPLGEYAGFAPAVQDGYTGAGGALPAAWRRMSDLTDLMAWADILNRYDANAALTRDAKAVIARTIGVSVEGM